MKPLVGNILLVDVVEDGKPSLGSGPMGPCNKFYRLPRVSVLLVCPRCLVACESKAFEGSCEVQQSNEGSWALSDPMFCYDGI